MPNMDGTGPRCTHHSIGRDHHNSMVRNHGGCGCGTGPCCQNPQDEKAALEARKEALQHSLDSIKKRLETL